MKEGGTRGHIESINGALNARSDVVHLAEVVGTIRREYMCDPPDLNKIGGYRVMIAFFHDYATSMADNFDSEGDIADELAEDDPFEGAAMDLSGITSVDDLNSMTAGDLEGQAFEDRDLSYHQRQIIYDHLRNNEIFLVIERAA